MSVTLETRVQVSSEVLHQQVLDEMIILDLEGEHYYGLNPVGARVWDLLDGDRSLAQVAEIISREFDAPLLQVQEDLIALIDAFLTASLAKIPSV